MKPFSQYLNVVASGFARYVMITKIKIEGMMTVAKSTGTKTLFDLKKPSSSVKRGDGSQCFIFFASRINNHSQ